MTAVPATDLELPRLPDGFRVRLAPRMTSIDDGRVLIGGSPLTVLSLTPRALRAVREGAVTVTDRASALLADRLLDTNLAVPDLSAAAPISSSELTVVIPVRDRPLQLDRTLRALRPLHCLVVDDASRDPSAVATVARRRGAHLIALTRNVGPAGARNVGLAQVHTRWVAFVDSDVVITPAELLDLSCHFADPRVALVGPRITGVARSGRPRWFERYDTRASSLTLGRRAGGVRPGADVAWLPGACLLGRTDALHGGFEASMRVGEDVDLVWRMAADGHRVRYDPTVEARHDTRTTLRAWLGRKSLYGSGGAALAERHGGALAPAVLTPGLALAAAAVLARMRISPLIAAAAVVATTWQLRRVLPDVPQRDRTAARLSFRGLGWALRQESALLLRHWWPATALALPLPLVRRALLSALVIDTVVAVVEHNHPDDRIPLLELIAGRRLDDLAYGAGLWYGAARARSARVLLPRRPRSRERQTS